MAIDMVGDVRDFMTLAGQQMPEAPTMPPRIADTMQIMHMLKSRIDLTRTMLALRPAEDVLALRIRIIAEEFGELINAAADADPVQAADALADLLYVVIGTGLAFGIDLRPVWDAVQDSNMQKFPPCTSCERTGFAGGYGGTPTVTCSECNGNGLVAVRDSNGKILKPPGWTPPNIAAVIRAQQIDTENDNG